MSHSENLALANYAPKKTFKIAIWGKDFKHFIPFTRCFIAAFQGVSLFAFDLVSLTVITHESDAYKKIAEVPWNHSKDIISSAIDAKLRIKDNNADEQNNFFEGVLSRLDTLYEMVCPTSEVFDPTMFDLVFAEGSEGYFSHMDGVYNADIGRFAQIDLTPFNGKVSLACEWMDNVFDVLSDVSAKKRKAAGSETPKQSEHREEQPPQETLVTSHLLDEIDLGIESDLAVLPVALRDGLSLFEGKPNTVWTRFLMRCLVSGVLANLLELSEVWASRDNQELDLTEEEKQVFVSELMQKLSPASKS